MMAVSPVCCCSAFVAIFLLAFNGAGFPLAAAAATCKSHRPDQLKAAFISPPLVTSAAAARTSSSRKGHFSATACARGRIARAMGWRRPRAAGRWLPPAAADGEGEGNRGKKDAEEENEERGVYVPTENLLEDPSYLEEIMAKAAKLLPAVPATDGGVFKRASSHHCALRTANIARAMKFYSLLGLNEVVRFRAESARCAFLKGAGMRLELIEVPANMRPPPKAADLSVDMRSTGLNHIAFDVGPAMKAEGLGDMKAFLSSLNSQSEEMFGMSVRLVVSPYEQRIGQDIFDLAFIMDADGVLLELVHQKFTLDTEMPQAW